MTELTRASLLKRAAAIWNKMLDDVLKAGVKRDYNRFVGQVPSKNDVVRAAQADLRVLNDVAKAYGWDSVYIDEEEEPVKLGKITK